MFYLLGHLERFLKLSNMHLPSNKFTFIYISPIANNLNKAIFNIERKKEIESCKSEKAKKEKIAVWNLFEKILKEKLLTNSNELNVTKNKNGKWISDNLYFSFSHSKDLVMVGISSNPIGVDIQEIYPLKNAKSLAKLASIEINDENIDEIKIFEEWTKKEAAFKKSNGQTLLGNKIRVDKSTNNLFNNYNYKNSNYVAAISQDIELEYELVIEN